MRGVQALSFFWNEKSVFFLIFSFFLRRIHFALYFWLQFFHFFFLLASHFKCLYEIKCTICCCCWFHTITYNSKEFRKKSLQQQRIGIKLASNKAERCFQANIFLFLLLAPIFFDYFFFTFHLLLLFCLNMFCQLCSNCNARIFHSECVCERVFFVVIVLFVNVVSLTVSTCRFVYVLFSFFLRSNQRYIFFLLLYTI